ncbi:MAG TPA: hypothetical protein VEU33_50310 [Archangium sp.]|nr:hypothetical protein [Archangium sp.]
MARLPCFREQDAVRVPALSGPGISIAAAVYTTRNGTKSIRLSGICQRTAKVNIRQGINLLREIAVLLVCMPLYRSDSFSPLGSALVFDDDLRYVNGYQRGFFEIDVFSRTLLSPIVGRYFISATLGPQLSNVVEIELA